MTQWHDDMNLQGEFEEFRIYDHVLNPGEIKFNEMNGPDKLVVQLPSQKQTQWRSIQARISQSPRPILENILKPW